MVKVAFRRKSQGIERNKLFSQGTKNFQNLRYYSLIVVDPKYFTSSLAVSNVNCWLIGIDTF